MDARRTRTLAANARSNEPPIVSPSRGGRVAAETGATKAGAASGATGGAIPGVAAAANAGGPTGGPNAPGSPTVDDRPAASSVAAVAQASGRVPGPPSNAGVGSEAESVDGSAGSRSGPVSTGQAEGAGSGAACSSSWPIRPTSTFPPDATTHIV